MGESGPRRDQVDHRAQGRCTGRAYLQGRRELGLPPGALHEHHEAAGDIARQVATVVLLHQRQGQVNAGRHACRGDDAALPGSPDSHAGRIDATGLHFDSTEQAVGGARHVMAAILDWFDGRPVTVPSVHPGSRPIIMDTASALASPRLTHATPWAP
ncbi:hypothetical protein [Streptomyces sp. LaBMicrA B280]|uniref:hypothetical protein n=1 Tax=Streptomyces sp. LaBMicrA B280 TaxID=3391001 RepID=UPI003BA95A94